MRDQLLLCKHQKPTGTPKTSVDPLTHDVAYLDLNTQKIHPIGQAEGYWRTIFGEGAVLPISWTQGDTPPELDEHLPQVSVHYVHAKTHQILTRPGKRK